MGVTPPYRIETERLVIRCWEPPDARPLRAALDASLDHLRPWLPWAEREPQPLDEAVERLREFRGAFDRDEDYMYGIFSPDEDLVLGGTGLHPRVGTDGLEIGYWLAAASTGHGFAREATAALTRIAIEWCGVDRVEVRVDPANAQSLRVPRRLGFTEEATLRRRLPGKGRGELRDVVIFTLLASELRGTPCASVPVTCFDAAHRLL
jgi:RimJ/RimL family protein N-acetyltransferase